MTDQDGTRPSKILSGWKEIASYLGVEIRTAQSWERELGMPVLRLPGRVKSRISADPRELDDWRRGRNPSETATGIRSRGFWLWIAAGLVAAGLITGTHLWLNSPSKGPASAKLQDSDLIVLNSRGEELWRHNFPDGILRDSSLAIVRDIDRDSRSEVLFKHWPPDFESKGTSLYCFSSSGAIKWRFTPGRTVATRSRQLSGPYLISSLSIFSDIKPKGPAVVVASIHGWSHPSQVAVLDGNGNVMGEYMHSGHLGHVALADVNGDGKEELLVAGVNNGHDKATLVVFDPKNVHGASNQPADDQHQILGMASGTEELIIRFPRACFSEKFEPFNRVFKVMTGDTIRVYVSENIEQRGPTPYVVYEFDRRLNLRGVTVSDMFEQHHRELEARGLLDHSVSPQEIETLKQITVIRNSN